MQKIKGEDIDFYYLTTKEEVKDLIYILQSEKLIAIDTEVFTDYERWGDRASWRDPFTSNVRLIQVNVPNNPNPWIIDLLQDPESKPILKEWLEEEGIRKVAHNALFDNKHLKTALGLWIPNFWCTKVMMQRLGLCTGFKSSQMRGHSLKAMARDYFDIHLSKLEQASDWSRPILSPSQLEYAALDVGAPRSAPFDSLLLEGYYLFFNVLTGPEPDGFDVEYALEIDQEANQVLARVEYSGMPINVSMLDAIMSQARSELESLKLKLCTDLGFPAEQNLIFSNGVPQRVVIIPEKITRLLNSPVELVKTINQKLKETLGQPLSDLQSSTLESTLKHFESAADEDPSEEEDLDQEFNQTQSLSFGIELISNLLAYKEKVKMLGTDYRKLINPVTRCLHSSYQVIGASTGRMSSGGNEAFNCQNQSTVKILINEIPNPFQSDSILF